ncbi:MAG: C25 family cysteine peptidase [Chloroherpetonaceae bacterium]|nr:C25 family cysteine peptidase [Chloroherpetonaceae bacterium]
MPNKAAQWLLLLNLVMALSAEAQPNQLSGKTYVPSYHLRLVNEKVGGREFVRAELSESSIAEETLKADETGVLAPFVPVKVLYIGVPLGAALSISAKSLAGETKSEVLLSPFLGEAARYAEKDLAAKLRQSPLYQSAEVFPTSLARVVRYFFVGSQYVAEVQVAPLQYAAARRELRWHRLIELSWSFVPAANRQWSNPTCAHSDLDEEFLRRNLVNYKDAKAFRAPPSVTSQVGSAFSDSTGAWYNPSQPYLKLLTTEDGLYRISGAEIAAAGVSLSGIDPRTLRLIYKGKEMPILVRGEDDGRFDPTDEIEFLGSFNRGNPEPLLDEFTGNVVGTVTELRNAYSDTSVYWLTWGSERGRRVQTASATPRGTALAQSFLATYYIEQDCVYVTALTEQGQYITERVLGEGWAQRLFQVSPAFPTDAEQVSFQLEGALNTGIAQARLRFAHTTNGTAEFEVILNGAPIGTIPLSGRGAETYTLSFNALALRNGTNQLLYRLRRTGAQTAVAIVALDWIEFSYLRSFAVPTLERQFFFATGNTGQDIELSGVVEGDFVLYDLTDTVRLSEAVRSGERLRMSTSANKRYLFAEQRNIFRPIVRVHQAKLPLRSPNRTADYIIITHPLFRAQANRLAAFRASPQGGGYRTEVVETEQIYDEFGFGLYDPMAIRQFLKYAFENWRAPRPRYVVLFGGANRDVKKKLRVSSERPALVPTFGQPVSDIWFVSFSNDPARPFRNIPRMMIGRIPVYTIAEAETYLSKLLSHNQTAARAERWHKNFLFINGGFNVQEQQLFRFYANSIISTFVTPPPIAGRADTLYRDDQNPFVSTQLEAQIRSAMQRGSSVVHYIGHAGSNTWDLALGDPLTLQNRARYPLVLSWTCNTGRFAEPFGKSFAEKFLLSPEGGALCFIGTAGWGFPSLDHLLSQGVFRAICDTLRTAGEIWFSAHRAFREQFGFFSAALEGTIDHYNLQGDPAAPIPLATLPDLALEAGQATFLNQTLDESLAQPLSIVIENYGLATREGVSLRIYDRWAENPAPVLMLDTTLHPIGLRDSLVVQLRFTGQVGVHELELVIDEPNRIPEVTKANNRLLLRANVSANTVIGTKLPAFGVLRAERPVLTVLSRSERPNAPRIYQFELDTTDRFNSPLCVRSGNVQEGQYITEWRPSVLPLPNTPYFWRVRVLEGSSDAPWQVMPVSFSDDPALQTTWQQFGTHLLRNRLEGLVWQTNGLTNGTGRLPLIVRSVGLNAQLASLFYEIIVGEDRQFDIISIGAPSRGPLRGLNVVILDTAQGVRVSRVENFDFLTMFPYTLVNSDTSLPGRFTRLIDAMTPSQFALISLVDAVPDTRDIGMNPIRQRLEALGSQHFSRLRFRESWAFIGTKNRGFYAEAWGTRCDRSQQIGCDATQEVTTIDTAITIQRLRADWLTDRIGPAARWQRLSWQSTGETQQTRFTLIGVRLDGREDSLLTTTQRIGMDLSRIDAQMYPYLRLRATLQRSPATGEAPLLSAVTLAYTQAGDAALSYQTARVVRDSVEAGEPIELIAEVRNLGESTLRNIPVQLTRLLPSGARQTLQMLRIDSLLPNQATLLRLSANTEPRFGWQTVAIELDPNNQLAELSKQNNRVTLSAFVRADTIRPTATIEFDGRRIFNGETVRQRPRIVIRATDNTLSLTDTNSIRLFLNRRPIFYAQSNVLTFVPATLGNPTATVVFTPTLADGIYTLSVVVRDAAGNTADSATTTVRFVVESSFKVENLFNYPNPFSDKTEFAFRLTSPDDERPTEFKIYIYTIAGRLVQVLDAMPVISASWQEYYRIPWDGRDQDGDLLASGVYLYRVVVRSPKGTITKTERLAIVR